MNRTEYGAVVWYEPIREQQGRKHLKGSVALARRLERVQRVATRLITGAFKTTATDVMDFHAVTLPARLRLNLVVFNSAVRLASLPDHHPLAKHVHRCSDHYPRFHHSPLHELFNAFPHIRNVETIDATPRCTTWQPRFSYSIAATREAAIEEAGNHQDALVIFTDGSGFEGGTGAAAQARDRQGTCHVRRYHLGSLMEHTVFEGEVVGTILALDIARSCRRVRNVVILLDNQAAIMALQSGRGKSGRHLLDTFHHELDLLLRAKPHLHFHIAWVPGHEGVAGNEEVDAEAKRAAQGDSTSTHRKIPSLAHSLPKSAAALRAENKKLTNRLWGKSWSECDRGKRLARVDRNVPGRRTLKLYQQRRRHECSIITQLRTGHVGLNKFLYRIKATDSPLCVRCRVPETVDHYLLTCQRFTLQRHALRRRLDGPLSTRALLGDPNNISHTLEFIRATARFPSYPPPP